MMTKDDLVSKDTALKMAIECLEYHHEHSEIWGCDEEGTIQACKEALEQEKDYLYVYKGSEIWLKDTLDIPSAGFLIGKIRLEK